MKYLLILFVLLVSCSTHPRLFSNEGSLILKKKINRLIVSSELGATMGISIVSLKTGKPIYELNSEKLLMPASNNKLFTCAAALDFLGKDFFFFTNVLAQNENAILQGGGDPDLTVKDLDSLAYAVSKKVDSIDTLFLDDTFLDSVYFGNGWMWDEGPWWYAAPISALSVNDNCIDFYVQPGKEGQNAIINYFPNTNYISFQNQSLTVEKNTNLKKLKIDRDWSDKKNNFSVTGEIFYKEELDTLRRNIHDPTMFTGVLFKEMLEKHGLEINYVMKKKVSRNADTLATHKSLPLIKSASNLMNESDNLTAELFIKTIGRHNITQGNWKSGLDSVKSLLASSALIDTSQMRIADGSGVSRYNLTSAKQLTTFLVWVYESQYKNDFISTLPGGGKRNGTLERRLKTEGNYVKAKTGGLSGVSNLSGYVFSPRYGPVAFSLLMSGYRGSSQPYRNLQDAIIKQLLYG